MLSSCPTCSITAKPSLWSHLRRWRSDRWLHVCMSSSECEKLGVTWVLLEAFLLHRVYSSLESTQVLLPNRTCRASRWAGTSRTPLLYPLSRWLVWRYLVLLEGLSPLLHSGRSTVGSIHVRHGTLVACRAVRVERRTHGGGRLLC